MTRLHLMRLWAAWLALSASIAMAAPAQNASADPALEARVQALLAELRCLVCQNQSLADSHADLALDLKAQVREQLRAGRTPEQVLTYMTERYGDFVLYRPPWKASTLLLWLGPVLLLLGGGWGLWRGLRAARPVAADMSNEDARKAAELLGR